MSDQIQRRGGTTAQHAGFTGALREITIDTDKKVVVVHDGATVGGFPLAPAASPTFTGNTTASFVRGEFRKDAPTAVAFTVTAAFAVSTQTQMYIDVNGTCLTFASGTVVVMPSAVTGTDYAIWAETAGTITCTNNFVTPPTANARKIGGFHYAPGGNAAAQSGGNTTPYINAYSLWDLKFKPACNDPRGMTLVAGNFWADIYLLNTDPDTNGTSKYNVTIADGSSPPKVPTKFGGNGTTTYTTLTWWEANEVLAANGKRSASYQEYAALAFGTTEASAIGTDQVSTILNAVYTSKWGVMQSTGVMDVWGKDFGGGAGTAAWTANTIGRGSTYQLCNAVFFGGDWSVGVNAGSRCSSWGNSPTYSNNVFGSRGVVDHLLLD
jgi:Major tropism determinant N-terminal domain